jgi:hypothetical protein
MAKQPTKRGRPPRPPHAPPEDWLRGVRFDGPEDRAACEKFLRDIEALLRAEGRRQHGRGPRPRPGPSRDQAAGPASSPCEVMK